MMTYSLRRSLLLASILASGGLVVNPAIAADIAQGTISATGVDEIVVTAQKRSERLNDVPISISAASGEQLARQGISSPADLGRIVPGFSYQKSGFGPPVFSIRGVGVFDYSMGISPAVSVYVDQAPVPYLVMSAGAGFDVERVEVLKGPQGTLFGQNSTGGAINYIAAKPTSDPHAGLDLTYGRFNEVKAQGFVSGPIADGLRVRIAAKHEYQDPWQISQSRPDDRLGRRNFSQARVLADWDASSRLKIELSANFWQDRSDTVAAQFDQFSPMNLLGFSSTFAGLQALQPAPDNPRAADWDAGTSYRRDQRYYQFVGRADWAASDALTLTSITAYSNYRQNDLSDLDGTALPVSNLGIAGKIDTISQEIRAAYNFHGGVKLIVGGTFEDDHTDENLLTRDSFASNTGVGPLQFTSYDQIADQRSKTYAVFANVDVPITENVTAQGGVRYTKQDRKFQGCLRDAGDGSLANALALIPTSVGQAYSPASPGTCVTYVFQPTATPIFSRPEIIRDSLNEDNVSWRAGLNWKPSGDLLIYGNVTKGYKAGAFTALPAVLASQYTPVTQESVLAYEVGFKASFFDRRINFTAAGFYYDYRNKQIQGFTTIPLFGPTFTLINLPKSRVVGAEAQITVQPVNGLQLTAAGSYINTDVLISNPGAVDPLGGSLPPGGGYPFPNAPQWQLATNARYELELSSKITASFGGDVSYRSTTNAALGNLPIFDIRAYTLVGVFAGVETSNKRWRVELWGHNIFNTFYAIDAGHAGDVNQRTPGLPATYGVTLSSRF